MSNTEYVVSLREGKLRGGNRSETGIAAQETLPSIIRTSRKLAHAPYDYLAKALT